MMKFILMLLFCITGFGQAETNWKLIKDKDGIQVYSTQLPDHKLKHHKAVTRINKDADTILAALQDTDACPEWVYNCISNRMVEMIDVQQRIYHTVIHSPLWFKDRDFYLQSDVIYDPAQQTFTITLTAKPEHAEPAEDLVRVTDVAMIWRLQRIEEALTSVTYQVYIDPKLPIKTINHQMIKKSIYRTMSGLTQLVENPLYGETKYSASELEMLTNDE